MIAGDRQMKGVTGPYAKLMIAGNLRRPPEMRLRYGSDGRRGSGTPDVFRGWALAKPREFRRRSGFG